jgi:hypothetical protein
MAGASGFFKRLSNNDVSLTSSPGQMIIPIQFLDFFPDLTVQKDESPTGGPRQLAAEFQVTFVDGAFSKTVLARVIYYEPAITHPRPNAEIRFTFRDREVLGRLSADDVLRFESDGERYQVTRDVSGSHGADRFDWL